MMKRILMAFVGVLIALPLFALTIATEKKEVLAPIDANLLTYSGARRIFLDGSKLYLEAELEWEAWPDPRRNPRYFRKTVDLVFPDIIYDSATHELHHGDKKIGYTKEVCGVFGCYLSLELDYDYNFDVSANDGYVVDAQGYLILFDN